MAELSGVGVLPEAARRRRSVPRSSPGERNHYRIAVVVLMCFSFAASYLVYRIFVPLGSGDLDEGVYVFQAHMLLHGLVSLPADRYGEFFRPWLSGQQDGRIFTVYQIGFPAYLAASQLVFGSMHVGMALIAALIVPAAYGFAVELLHDRRIALTAAVFWALSPMFLMHSALLLSYPLSLLTLLSGGWAVLRGVRRDSRWMFALGGLLFGGTLLTRPFDAVPFGIPLVLFAVYRMSRGAATRRDLVTWRPSRAEGASQPDAPVGPEAAVTPRRSAPAAAGHVVGPMVLGLVPPALVTLWFNWQATGSPKDFPNVTADPLNTFGFGYRTIMIGQPAIHYTVGHAWDALGRNAGGGIGWLFGGPLLLVLAVAGLVALGRCAESVLLVVLAVAFPLAYFFWWATALSAVNATNGLGPHYYIPSFVPIVILGAVGFDRVLSTRRWYLVAGGFAVLVGVAAYAVPGKAQDKLHVTHIYRQVQRAVPADLHHAVVLVVNPGKPYLVSRFPFLQTGTPLRGNVLYAADRGMDDLTLMRQMPSRRFYVLRQQYEPGDALFEPTGRLTVLHVVSGERLRVTVRSAAPAPGTFARAYLSVGRQHHVVALGHQGSTTPGTASWTVVATDATSAGPGVVPVPPARDASITVGVETSTSPNFAAPQRTEYRMHYRATTSTVTAMPPGFGWAFVRFPDRTAWLPTDVSDHLRVTVTPLAS